MDTTVVKGLRVLELLARSKSPLALATVADELGINKSNAHRLLDTLSHCGFVRREAGTRRYMSSLKLWELGGSLVARSPLRSAGTAQAIKLHHKTGQTVTLCVLEDDEVLVLEKVLAPRPTPFLSHVGCKVPLLSLCGLVMMAYEPDRDRIIDRLAAGGDMVGDRRHVETRLEDVRRVGYAYGRSKHVPTNCGIAVGIPTGGGRATAALMVSGGDELLQDDRRQELAADLSTACARIATAMSC